MIGLSSNEGAAVEDKGIFREKLFYVLENSNTNQEVILTG
jgi:hypothetical protein